MNGLFRKNDDENDNDEVIVAAVEGGGTSFVVAIAKVDSSLSKKHTPPTVLHRKEVDSSHDDPDQTLKECAAFLEHHKPKGGYHALGVASFGPVGLNPSDVKRYGRIGGTTPKKSWRHFDLLTPLRRACEGQRRPLAVQFETDVNAPALAEYLLVQDQLSSLAYVTVGTGVGVGLVIHGKPVHGRMHPEAGHLPVQPLPGDNFGGYSWGGKAPFHGKGTVEGIASSVALTERLQARTDHKNSNNIKKTNNLDRSKLATLTDDDEIWDHAANAIATLCVSLLLTTAVEKIVLGGGIMNRTVLLPKIRQKTVELLNWYLPLPQDMSTLITTSTAHGSQVGLIGALVLAQHAYDESIASTKNRIDGKRDSAFQMGMLHGVVLGAVAGAVGGMLLCHKRG